MTRMIGMLVSAPVFSRKEFFVLGKIAFAFWTSALLIYVVPAPISPPDTGLTFIFMFISEFLIGVLIGFIMDFFIIAVEFAGSLMDTQAGLSVSAILDPSSGRSLPLLSLLLKWTATMIFLAIDGHHLVLSSLLESYRLLPIGHPVNFSKGMLFIVTTTTDLFAIGVQLAAPIMLVVFMIDFGFGMLNKVAEQVNVFQLGFQIKPITSLTVFLFTVPGLINSVYRIMDKLSHHLLMLLYYLSGVTNG